MGFGFNERPAQTGQRIVVADDDDVICRLIGHVLKREGFQVVTSANGEEVLELIQSRKPDAIILDAMMPGIDGLEVLHQLRSDENTRDIPVLMLSSRSLEKDVVTGFDFGANDYLVKPFKPEELVTRLKRILKATQQRDRDAS